MLYDRDDRMPRVEWLREYSVNDRRRSGRGRWDCRGRRMGDLGRRVFYSRQRTLEWFTAQEAKSLLGGETP